MVQWAVPAAVLLAAVAGSLVAARRSTDRAFALGLVAANALLAVALALGGTGSHHRRRRDAGVVLVTASTAGRSADGPAQAAQARRREGGWTTGPR